MTAEHRGASSTTKCTAFEGFVELMLRCAESYPLSWAMVEFVFDARDLLFGERAEIAALGKVLAQQAVEILVATSLPGRVGLGDVADSPERDVDQGMLCELAAIVPSDCVHAPIYRIERMHDRPHRRLGFSAGDAAQPRQTGLAFDQGHDARRPFTDDTSSSDALQN